MNLYLISQTVNNNYDSYDSAVVAAESEEKARLIHPAAYNEAWMGASWCKPEDVQVQLIGVAVDGTVAGIICASFNAG